MNADWRASNDLSVGQIYLYDNPGSDANKPRWMWPAEAHQGTGHIEAGMPSGGRG
jgi:hypothetical protein